jgi:Protein of unknown function (DUF3761)/Bacterial SH3 domain
MRRISITLAVGLLPLLILLGCISRQPSSTQTSRAIPPQGSSTLVSTANTPQAASNSQQVNQGGSVPQGNQNAELAVVKSVRANLREHPSLSSTVVEEVRQGEALALLSRSPVGPWYKVRHRETGSEGWVHGNGIVITRPGSELATRRPQETLASGTATTTLGNTTSGRSYTNVDGERVPSPVFSNSAPAGASARCGDGSYSFSCHRRGTCSHHGGVAEWLRNDIP